MNRLSLFTRVNYQGDFDQYLDDQMEIIKIIPATVFDSEDLNLIIVLKNSIRIYITFYTGLVNTYNHTVSHNFYECLDRPYDQFNIVYVSYPFKNYSLNNRNLDCYNLHLDSFNKKKILKDVFMKEGSYVFHEVVTQGSKSEFFYAVDVNLNNQIVRRENYVENKLLSLPRSETISVITEKYEVEGDIEKILGDFSEVIEFFGTFNQDQASIY